MKILMEAIQLQHNWETCINLLPYEGRTMDKLPATLSSIDQEKWKRANQLQPARVGQINARGKADHQSNQNNFNALKKAPVVNDVAHDIKNLTTTKLSDTKLSDYSTDSNMGSSANMSASNLSSLTSTTAAVSIESQHSHTSSHQRTENGPSQSNLNIKQDTSRFKRKRLKTINSRF